MKYKYSTLDKRNLEWFKNDDTVANLHSLELRRGTIRSLHPFKISFDYPISAISGKNCSGKTTILAMCACAYHNSKGGYKLDTRRQNYYTFSDFFIQSQEDIPPAGIRIIYGILHNRWTPTKFFPYKKGLAYQSRIKRVGGRWNNYERRVNRNVVFLGVDRVVPPSEKSTAKTYKAFFHAFAKFGWESEVMDIVGRILGKKYYDFWYTSHSKYKLPIVKTRSTVYSGFNMGAGENAIFEILFHIFKSGPGTLLVIDEIELGLHEEAQIILIDELKKIAIEKKVQIICTTHSPKILNSLPPKGRYYIDSLPGATTIYQGISSKFASGMMAGQNTSELEIYVEDDVSKAIIETILDHNIRNRCEILEIGSSTTMLQQMAARFRNAKVGECLSIFDGDQRSELSTLNEIFIRNIGSFKTQIDAQEWFNSRIEFLPGSIWPEKWLLQNIDEPALDFLSNQFSINIEVLKTFIERAILSGKHKEVYILSNLLNANEDHVLRSVVKSICIKQIKLFNPIFDVITKNLSMV